MKLVKKSVREELKKEYLKRYDRINVVNRFADNLDVESAYAVGRRHLTGYRTFKNISLGTLLIQEAARHNHPPALHDLAYMYEIGMGVTKNKKLSNHYYRECAWYATNRKNNG